MLQMLLQMVACQFPAHHDGGTLFLQCGVSALLHMGYTTSKVVFLPRKLAFACSRGTQLRSSSVYGPKSFV